MGKGFKKAEAKISRYHNATREGGTNASSRDRIRVTELLLREVHQRTLIFIL